ncbi:MAG: hypothetical protein HZB50_15715 [Chloroflexi bacterium]|nr:hypothetical protein [Chloroflexota bacterium]
MKGEISNVLGYLEPHGDERIIQLIKWILELDESQPGELNLANLHLRNEIKQPHTQSYEHVGFYYLFLGCITYEQGNYKDALHNLQNAANEVWGSHINKSLMHWILGLCYYQIGECPKACEELQEALNILSINTCVNTLRLESENSGRQEVRDEIEKVLHLYNNGSLFGNALSRRTQDTACPSANSHPANNQGVSPEEIEKMSDLNSGGYILFQSLPIYNQPVAASNSGCPENDFTKIGFAETSSIILENIPHKVYSLKSTSKEINIPTNGKNWGWAKVNGHSMNNISSVTNMSSIMDGDFILILFCSDADDNDIVLASWKDKLSDQFYYAVKRYKKSKQELRSETTERGMKYDPLNLNENNASIRGVVYAVAKPRL